MPNKKSLIFCGTFAFSVALSITPALAGFQWVAPDNGNYQQPTVITGPGSGASVATGSPEIISPVIITGGSNGNYAPQQQIMQAPNVVTSPAPTVTYTEQPNMATATIAVPANSGSVVQGFASQIPLALALRQILPVGYNFSIDQNIDMETIVSYKGGKNWRETLSDMLSTVGLTAHEQGAAISVSRLSIAQTAQIPAPVAVPMPVSMPGPAVVMPTPLDGTTISVARPMMGDTMVVARSPDLPMVNVGGVDGWSAERGDTLHKVLTDWCKRAGVELQWVAEYDYPMEASASFNSDFEDAVRSLLAGFENARPQPVAELHTNASAGQKLLVVQARGNSYSN